MVTSYRIKPKKRDDYIVTKVQSLSGSYNLKGYPKSSYVITIPKDLDRIMELSDNPDVLIFRKLNLKGINHNE